MTRYEWLSVMRDAGAVQRFHTTRMLRPQSQAAHGWGVAMVLLAVGAPPSVLAYALVHDTPELWTGDVPSPAKWRSPELESALRQVECQFFTEHGIDKHSLNDVEMALIKWADYFELAQQCMEEARMGNAHYVRRMLSNALRCMQQARGKLQALARCRRRARALWPAGVVLSGINDMSLQLHNDAQVFLHGES